MSVYKFNGFPYLITDNSEIEKKISDATGLDAPWSLLTGCYDPRDYPKWIRNAIKDNKSVIIFREDKYEDNNTKFIGKIIDNKEIQIEKLSEYWAEDPTYNRYYSSECDRNDTIVYYNEEERHITIALSYKENNTTKSITFDIIDRYASASSNVREAYINYKIINAPKDIKRVIEPNTNSDGSIAYYVHTYMLESSKNFFYHMEALKEIYDVLPDNKLRIKDLSKLKWGRINTEIVDSIETGKRLYPEAEVTDVKPYERPYEEGHDGWRP